MYFNGEIEPIRTNGMRLQDAIKRLKRYSASRFGLPERTKSSWITKDTSLEKRRTFIGTDCTALKKENTVLFTGQCLVKEEEDRDCPITLEDAIECERLKEIMQKNGLKTICILPDSVYALYLRSDNDAEDQDLIYHAT
ncbi:MAG: hypothetical protein Q7K43_00990, partial [Candidatus Woesearchaeota archaeon]|nr:hypothetical protein [Candidatus Woesearchaeota archaeon]